MQRKKLVTCLILILTLSSTISTSVSAIDLTFTPTQPCNAVEANGHTWMVCDEEAQQKIDLGLIERDECFDELEARVDKSAGKRIFWLGVGLVMCSPHAWG